MTFRSLNYHFQSLLCPLLLYQLDLLWYKFMNQNNVYYKSPSRFLICLCVWYYYHHYYYYYYRYYILNLLKRNLFIIIISPIYHLIYFYLFFLFLYVPVCRCCTHWRMQSYWCAVMTYSKNKKKIPKIEDIVRKLFLIWIISL